VFMAVLFLARAARLLSDRLMAEEAMRQTLLHLQALQDEDTGLLFHGWNCEAGDWMSAARWNRANAWNLCAVPMIREELAHIDADVDRLGEIGRRYGRLAEAVAARQNATGL
jgi:unsaturated rhamnogalacturonyl hydrolase